MKYKIILLILFVILAISSCGLDGDSIRVNGPIITEARIVDDFTSVHASLAANIFISQGPEQSLEIITHDDVMPHVRARVSNGILLLEMGRSVRNLDRLEIHITSPDFEEVRLSGAANLRSEGCIVVDDLEIRLSGAGNINLCGEAEELGVRISGAGNFQSYDMVAQTVDATVSGAGNMRVTAEQVLDVTISGAGSIFYKGTPQINSNISGAGALVNAN